MRNAYVCIVILKYLMDFPCSIQEGRGHIDIVQDLEWHHMNQQDIQQMCTGDRHQSTRYCMSISTSQLCSDNLQIQNNHAAHFYTHQYLRTPAPLVSNLVYIHTCMSQESCNTFHKMNSHVCPCCTCRCPES